MFIVYVHDSPDAEFVENEVVPLMAQHNLNVKTEDCFTIGEDIFSNLERLLDQCQGVVVIVSRDLLGQGWKLYQLNQAIYREIEDRDGTFKVVLLMREDPATLGPLPQNVRGFLRNRITVKEYVGNWQLRLIFELRYEQEANVPHYIEENGEDSFVEHNLVCVFISIFGFIILFFCLLLFQLLISFVSLLTAPLIDGISYVCAILAD